MLYPCPGCCCGSGAQNLQKCRVRLLTSYITYIFSEFEDKYRTGLTGVACRIIHGKILRVWFRTHPTKHDLDKIDPKWSAYLGVLVPKRQNRGGGIHIRGNISRDSSHPQRRGRGWINSSMALKVESSSTGTRCVCSIEIWTLRSISMLMCSHFTLSTNFRLSH